MTFVYVLASALLAGSPATAQEGGAQQQQQQQQSSQTANRGESASANGQAPAEERRTCRRIEADTGSRMSSSQRVCMTEREWARYDREAE